MDEEAIASRADRALDREERETLGTSLLARTPRGHLLAWTAAAIEAIPVLGAFVPLLTEYIPNEQQSRMNELLQNIARETNRLGVTLDSAEVLRRPVAVLVEEALERSVRAEADGKRGYYASAIVNTARQQDIDEEDLARMRSALHALRPSNLRVLSQLVELQHRLADSPPGEYLALLVEALPEVPDDRLRLDAQDLMDLQLIDQHPTYDYGPVSSGRLTEFGTRFAAWLSLDEDRSEP